MVTGYSESANARGALYALVFITDDEEVDFMRSALVALNRSTSLSYTLPFGLSPGLYRVLVYDIEHDGTLSTGVGYPAVQSKLSNSRNNQGTC